MVGLEIDKFGHEFAPQQLVSLFDGLDLALCFLVVVYLLLEDVTHSLSIRVELLDFDLLLLELSNQPLVFLLEGCILHHDLFI